MKQYKDIDWETIGVRAVDILDMIKGYIPVGHDYGWLVTVARVNGADYLDSDIVRVKFYAAEIIDDVIIHEMQPVKSFTFIDAKGEGIPDLRSYIYRIYMSEDWSVIHADQDETSSTEDAVSIGRNNPMRQLEVLVEDEETNDPDAQYLAHYVYGRIWDQDHARWVLAPIDIMKPLYDENDDISRTMEW